MHPDSLCRLCSDPSKCPLCDVMRNPRPLTMRSIGAIRDGRKAPAPRVTRTVDAKPFSNPAADARVAAEAVGRKAALQAEVDALKVGIASYGARKPVTVASVDPEASRPTAPVPPEVTLVPAPAPLSVAALRGGDWVGLAALVDAGLLTKAEAERIGSEWMRTIVLPQGVTARA